MGFVNTQWKTINLGDFRNFELLQDEDYIARDGTHYRLPAFAPSDLASVPPIFWGAPLFLIPCGWYARPAYGHDCAFKNNLLLVNGNGTSQRANLTEKASNALLLEMMESVKPNPTLFEIAQRDAIYEGVTIGGWHAYKEDRTKTN